MHTMESEPMSKEEEVLSESEELEALELSTESIMNEIIAGAAVHAAATQNFIDTFSFYGKSLSEWSDDLAIAVPEEISPDVMRDLYRRLANNIQIASHFFSVASTINSTLVGGGQLRRADLITAIVRQYAIQNKRRPAGTVIEQMADSYMSSTASAVVASKIVKDFWRHHLDALIEVRKCLEQIGISMHTELKYLGE